MSVIRGSSNRNRRTKAHKAFYDPLAYRPPSIPKQMRTRGARPVTDRDRGVLAALAASGAGTTAQDLTRGGLSVGQVRYSLGVLRENGLAQASRDGTHTTWVVTDR